MDKADHSLFAAALLALFSVAVKERFLTFAMLLPPAIIASRLPNLFQRERRASTHSLAFLIGTAFAVWLLLTLILSTPPPGYLRAIPIPLVSLPSLVAKAWVLGLASHLMSDALTGRGVCLLYPLPFWLSFGLEENSTDLRLLIAIVALVAFSMRVAASPYLCSQLERFITALFS